jgi:hypothetical protein
MKIKSPGGASIYITARDNGAGVNIRQGGDRPIRLSPAEAVQVIDAVADILEGIAE